MTQHLVFLLLGLGNGAVFGALALAIVLTYRSSGVVNFGSGAIALYTAYIYAFLRQGKLLLLIPGLPDSWDFGTPLGFWPALLIALAVSALVGLVLYVLIFRPLRTAPPVAKAVAALGVSLLVSSLVAVKLGTTPVAVRPIFPAKVWRHDQLVISSDRVYFAAAILVVAVVLMAVLRFTRFGLHTRAAAETERGAYLSGISPDRIAAYNWMLSSAVAGLAGILIAPIVPLVPEAYTLFIVPALAAAIVARFEYVVWAVVVGIVIGALQSDAQHLEARYSKLPSAGLPELIPLVLIMLVLVIRARALPGRGSIILQSLGRAPRPQRLLPTSVVMAVVSVLGLVLLHDRWRNGLIVTFIMAIVALSTVVVTGYAGQVSLAQLTIAGTGGFILGPIGDHLHVPFPFAPLLAALGAAALGVLVGLPALRIRGLPVAVVTLAMAFAVEALWFRNSDFVGEAGVHVPTPSLFGWNLGIGSGLGYPRVRFGILCLVVLFAVAIGVALLRRSQLGSQMLAVKANERSAAAAGVSVVRVKILAFGIAAFIAGLGGCLLAYQQQTITATSFSAMAGLALFGTVYLCGATSISGGLLAGVSATNGILFILIDEVFSASGWYPVVAAVLLVFTVILNPEGIVGPAHSFLAKRRSGDASAMGSVVARAEAELTEPIPATFDPDAGTELELSDVSVRYGGVVAVNGVSLKVPQGAIVGLIGPNGAGKTTLIDAISGFATHAGAVRLAGDPLEGKVPHERIRAGLGRTFQAIELYDDLSVLENVKVGLTAAGHRVETGTVPSFGDAERLDATLRLLGLNDVRERPASELSQGQRQLVSIARALAGHPRVLLLDEPAGGLDTAESQWLGERLRRIREAGVTIIVVDHDMGLMLGLCDQITVLNFGEVIASGTPAEIRVDPRVAEAYLGTHGQKAVTA
ncbi:branched-chain amino acid ABC transporter permease/ATP-binding protein [Nocardioides sp. BP30]|uniref:branched-chain amino acid ABC transporter permease/ATP-binding protein n=1 Tax=Nocardioides sp. BP30 TaxID=3036374 RepID=UPI0024687CE8|nr:branched-chain amino acid ABC transporter permease/ATP-binding protein [Nocardioides sp. BP30]WGL54087.1 branched-chain amino acid ABC transporter permease/ATP-binding protein [Nocardioides sp. BP30]